MAVATSAIDAINVVPKLTRSRYPAALYTTTEFRPRDPARNVNAGGSGGGKTERRDRVERNDAGVRERRGLSP